MADFPALPASTSENQNLSDIFSSSFGLVQEESGTGQFLPPPPPTDFESVLSEKGASDLFVPPPPPDFGSLASGGSGTGELVPPTTFDVSSILGEEGASGEVFPSTTFDVSSLLGGSGGFDAPVIQTVQEEEVEKIRIPEIKELILTYKKPSVLRQKHGGETFDNNFVAKYSWNNFMRQLTILISVYDLSNTDDLILDDMYVVILERINAYLYIMFLDVGNELLLHNKQIVDENAKKVIELLQVVETFVNEEAAPSCDAVNNIRSMLPYLSGSNYGKYQKAPIATIGEKKFYTWSRDFMLYVFGDASKQVNEAAMEAFVKHCGYIVSNVFNGSRYPLINTTRTEDESALAPFDALSFLVEEPALVKLVNLMSGQFVGKLQKTNSENFHKCVEILTMFQITKGIESLVQVEKWWRIPEDGSVPLDPRPAKPSTPVSLKPSTPVSSTSVSSPSQGSLPTFATYLSLRDKIQGDYSTLKTNPVGQDQQFYNTLNSMMDVSNKMDKSEQLSAELRKKLDESIGKLDAYPGIIDRELTAKRNALGTLPPQGQKFFTEQYINKRPMFHSWVEKIRENLKELQAHQSSSSSSSSFSFPSTSTPSFQATSPSSSFSFPSTSTPSFQVPGPKTPSMGVSFPSTVPQVSTPLLSSPSPSQPLTEDQRKKIEFIKTIPELANEVDRVIYSRSTGALNEQRLDSMYDFAKVLDYEVMILTINPNPVKYVDDQNRYIWNSEKMEKYLRHLCIEKLKAAGIDLPPDNVSTVEVYKFVMSMKPTSPSAPSSSSFQPPGPSFQPSGPVSAPSSFSFSSFTGPSSTPPQDPKVTAKIQELKQKTEKFGNIDANTVIQMAKYLVQEDASAKPKIDPLYNQQNLAPFRDKVVELLAIHFVTHAK